MEERDDYSVALRVEIAQMKELEPGIESEELRRRMIQFAARLGVANPHSSEHPDRDKERGRYWRNLRKAAGYSRKELAAGMGVPDSDLAYFEQGLVSHLDMKEDFMPRLRAALAMRVGQ